MDLLEKRLNREDKEFRWETAVLAVLGYNLPMQNEVLRTAGLPLDPDLVIYGYFRNDDDFPAFLRIKRHVLSFESFINYYYHVFFLPDRGSFGHVFERASAMDHDAREAAHAPMAGVPAFRRALSELGRIGRRAHVPVVLFEFEEEFQHPGYLPASIVHIRGGAAAKQLGDAFTLSAHDNHPTREGHAALARHLYRGLVESGVLDAAREHARRRGKK
jgi:hypothetical protein